MYHQEEKHTKRLLTPVHKTRPRFIPSDPHRPGISPLHGKNACSGKKLFQAVQSAPAAGTGRLTASISQFSVPAGPQLQKHSKTLLGLLSLTSPFKTIQFVIQTFPKEKNKTCSVLNKRAALLSTSMVVSLSPYCCQLQVLELQCLVQCQQVRVTGYPPEGHVVLQRGHKR